MLRGPRLQFLRHLSASRGDRRHSSKSWTTVAAGAGLATTLLAIHHWRRSVAAEGVSPDAPDATGAYGQEVAGMPFFSAEQVAQHDSREKRIWVTFRSGVYDVTDFVDVYVRRESRQPRCLSSSLPFAPVFAHLAAAVALSPALSTQHSLRASLVMPNARFPASGIQEATGS